MFALGFKYHKTCRPPFDLSTFDALKRCRPIFKLRTCAIKKSETFFSAHTVRFSISFLRLNIRQYFGMKIQSLSTIERLRLKEKFSV